MRNANGLEDVLSDQLTKALLGDGDPNSQSSVDRAEFYSNVLSKTAEKFTATDQGQAVVDQALLHSSVYAFVPGVLMGLAAGYFLFRRK